MTHPARHQRDLPVQASDGFVLDAGESLALGLRRVTLAQFDVILGGLTDPEVELDVGIHEARKAMKRLRAVLRLVRGAIGDPAYRAENATLRDAARSLAGVRDSAVMVQAMGEIRAEYGQLLASGVLGELDLRLQRRAELRRRRVVEDSDLLRTTALALYRARSRFAGWPVDPADPRFGRRVIRDDFASLAKGLAATYGRGREEMRDASRDGSVESFHLWRKRAKYLRHQVELLEPMWPEVLHGLARSVDSLGETLGKEHDLAELLRLVSEVPEVCPDPAERSLLVALVQQRRRELQRAALLQGARIYAEPPVGFVGRFGRYFAAWRGAVEPAV